MVIDYRDTKEAETEANLIEHTEFLLVDDEIHIITKSYAFKKINYFIWKNNELLEQKINYINPKADWIRLVKTDDDLLFIYNYDGMLFTHLEIYSSNQDKIIYNNRHFIEDAYFYVNLKDNDVIQVYGICGKDKIYSNSKSYIYEISKK